MAELDGTEVTVTFIVTRTLSITTTANAVRAELQTAGLAAVVEPDDLDAEHDATDLVFALLAGNDGMERDAWLTGLAAMGQVDIEDEAISVEEVSEV
jgi:hypothetical protein